MRPAYRWWSTVMVAKGGHRLLLSEAEAALRDTLLPMAALITPNLPEPKVLAAFRCARGRHAPRRERLVQLGAGPCAEGAISRRHVVDLLLHEAASSASPIRASSRSTPTARLPPRLGDRRAWRRR